MEKKSATLIIENNISIITLDDGKANVFSPKMIQDVNDCLDQVPTQKGALIITGRDGMFSAGFDLKIISAGEMSAITEMTTNLTLNYLESSNFKNQVLALMLIHMILGLFI